MSEEDGRLSGGGNNFGDTRDCVKCACSLALLLLIFSGRFILNNKWRFCFISWSLLTRNTGIAEVELPIEFKLKNIEETEELKARCFSWTA